LLKRDVVKVEKMDLNGGYPILLKVINLSQDIVVENAQSRDDINLFDVYICDVLINHDMSI
jgi:hypothetical protein